MQCTNSIFLDQIGKSNESFPFDSMLSNPKFVFEILDLLLDKNLNIEELVTNHFYLCDRRCSFSGVMENYITSIDGFALYNTKYNVIFPHTSSDDVSTYIRRFTRLKDLIVDSKEDVCFIYSSQASLDAAGNFTIDGNPVVRDTYLYLDKIYELIGKFKTNYEFIVFNSIKENDEQLKNKNILLIELAKSNTQYGWPGLVEMMHSHKQHLG